MSDLHTLLAPLIEADPTPSKITEVRVISSEHYEALEDDGPNFYGVILECEITATGDQFELQYCDELSKPQAEKLVSKLSAGTVLEIDLKYWI